MDKKTIVFYSGNKVLCLQIIPWAQILLKKLSIVLKKLIHSCLKNLSHTHNSAGAFCREGGTNTSYSLCRSISAMSQTTATGGVAKNGDASFTANCDYSEQKPRKRGGSPEKHYCTDSLWIGSRTAQSMCQTPTLDLCTLFFQEEFDTIPYSSICWRMWASVIIFLRRS